MPSFYFKQDVIPGRDEQFSMTPTAEGTFAGRCAELCGCPALSDAVQGEVVSQDEFDEHIQELDDAGQIGAPRGGENSEEIAGLEQEGHAGGPGPRDG